MSIKSKIIALVVAGVVFAPVAFYSLGLGVTIIVLSFYVVFISIYMIAENRDKKLHQEWIKNPKKIGNAEFDNFFWNLNIHNQDWYVENILREKGLRELIDHYEITLRQIWQECDMPVWEKLMISNDYFKRLNSLLIMHEFTYGD